MTSNKQPTAAMIVIGNEVLSGRTKDKNIGWVAEQLEQNGIKLVEARIIQDDKETNISTIKEISDPKSFFFNILKKFFFEFSLIDKGDTAIGNGFKFPLVISTSIKAFAWIGIKTNKANISFLNI